MWLAIKLIILAAIANVKAKTCLCTNNGEELNTYFRDYRYTGVEDDTIPRGHQAIIPSYKFNCSGCITEWGMDVHKGGEANSRVYTLDLQVWRPSPTDQGCYSLVGNNRLTSVPLETQVARVTPLPNEWIEVQQGDVIGFFVDNPNNDKNGVVAPDVLTESPQAKYTMDVVWYGDIRQYTPSNSECPYLIGTQSNAILNTKRMAAPVISLAMTDACSPRPVLPETSESSTSTPGISTSDSDNTLQPTDQTSESNTTPQASAIADNATSTTSQGSRSNGVTLIAALTGGSTGALLFILVIVLAVVSLAVCARSEKYHKKADFPSASTDNDDDDLTTNYNYGVSMHPMAKHRYSMDNAYDTPNAVFPAVQKLVTKRNEAYNVTLTTVDEVAIPTQNCNSFEYDYVQ